MRIRFYTLAALALALVPAAQAAGQGATDLSMRRALYFTGAKGVINTKTDRYVVENGTMTLKQSEATKCEDGGCYFNIGFIAFRRPASGALSSNATIKKSTGGLDGIELPFPVGAATLQRVLNVKLPIGAKTQLTFQIDPQMKTAETDETNNSFTVTVVVEGKP